MPEQEVTFTVLGKPEPQGSHRAIVRNWRAIMLQDNSKLLPFRQQVGWSALRARPGSEIFAGSHVPVSIEIVYYLAPPKAMKGRTLPAYKPDVDKLTRAVFDALTGILWDDDAQVCSVAASKRYGNPPRTEITVSVID